MGLLSARSRLLAVDVGPVTNLFFRGGCGGFFQAFSGLSLRLGYVSQFRSKLASVIKEFQLFG